MSSCRICWLCWESNDKGLFKGHMKCSIVFYFDWQEYLCKYSSTRHSLCFILVFQQSSSIEIFKCRHPSTYTPWWSETLNRRFFSTHWNYPLSLRLTSINVDDAAVNTGIHSGLGVKFKETTPWISVIHCFKDFFDGTFFKDIITMLVKLYYLYRKSPK